MLTNFYKWYDQVQEPWRLFIALAFALPLILGCTAMPHMHTMLGFGVCWLGILYSFFLLVTRIKYIHRRVK